MLLSRRYTQKKYPNTFLAKSTPGHLSQYKQIFTINTAMVHDIVVLLLLTHISRILSQIFVHFSINFVLFITGVNDTLVQPNTNDLVGGQASVVGQASVPSKFFIHTLQMSDFIIQP